MRNFTFKIFLIACFIGVAGYSNAQFKFTSNTNIGQTLTTDKVNFVDEFVVDFSTAKATSTWEYIDSTSTYVITLGKCQTQKGLQVNVFDADSTTKVINGDFECRDYGANRNPVHVASVDSLMGILHAFEMKNAGTGDSVKNVRWKPSACLFDVNGDPANQAFGAHPGKYKIVEYGFQFSFSGFLVSNDITFDIDTYDEGNTGKTASYTLTVATGSASNIIGTVDNFYVTGSGKKSVSLAAAIGANPSVFGNTKVYFFLKTYGTGEAMAEGSYDPTIVFDNMVAKYDLPQWIVPSIGVVKDSLLNNMGSPAMGAMDTETTFAMHLKGKARFGQLTIIHDLQDKMTTPMFTFPDTMAVMGNDGNGNYTVPVEYTLTPSTYNSGNGQWSKAQLTLAAPSSGTIDDDIVFYFKATPKSMQKFDRFEINNGTRFRYDFYFQGIPAMQEWNFSDSIFNSLGDIVADTMINGLSIYATSAAKVTVDVSNKTVGDMVFTHRLKSNGSGKFNADGTPDVRVYGFNVAPNTKISIVLQSGSSSSDRFLLLAAGSNANVIDTMDALGASAEMVTYDYTADTATTIYVYSSNSGINIYYIKAEVIVPASILFVGSGTAEAKNQSDINVMGMLADAGYTVTYADDNDIAAAGFDYSSYEAAVLSAGCSSSNIVQFAKDGYPVPVVSMQQDAARKDKWGWTGSTKSDNKEMFVSKNYNTTTAQMTVTNTGHYITQGYTMEEMLMWTFGTADSSNWSGKEIKSYMLTDSVPTAIALGKIATDDAGSMTNWWAVPRGSSVRTAMSDGTYSRINLMNRIVLLTVFNDGLLYPTDEFGTMLTKSLEWVLGEGPVTAVPVMKEFESDVTFYPNPARESARIRFTMNKMDEVSLSVYNLMGQEMRIVTPQMYTEGVHEIDVRTGELNTGMYIYVLQVGSELHKGKFNVMK